LEVLLDDFWLITQRSARFPLFERFIVNLVFSRLR
jgi:hypothetical protein